MSDSISIAASPYNGRGKQQQQQHQQQRQPLMHQQQQQLQRYRDRSAAKHADVEMLSPPPHQHTPQQQQQQQRSRRPRSIHITLRKTRSGSRPVNIQRSQQHGTSNNNNNNNANYNLFTSSGNRVSSPNGGGGVSGAVNSGEGKDGAEGYPLLDDEAPTSTFSSPNQTCESVYPQGRSRAGSSSTDGPAAAASATTAHQHGRVGSNSLMTHTSGGGGSSSSSLNGHPNNNNNNSSVAPSLPAAPQLNTFMKPPYSTLQQLLPPSMRDRAASSSNTNNNNNNNGSSSGGGGNGGANAMHGQNSAAANRLRSRSQLYISGSSVPQLADPAAANAPSYGTTRLRSHSSAGQFDALTGSYSGVLGDFVFPYPDRTTPRHPPRTPSLSADPNALLLAANAPTINFDSRSPRLSPPVAPGSHDDVTHHRARSYTAGGHSRPFTHRSNNGPVVTASMAGAGGAALFGGHTHSNSVSHAESYASRNLDRSLSTSSNPNTMNATTTAATATLPATAGGGGANNSNNNNNNNNTSTLAPYNVNTSRSSARSGTTRETTPVSTAAGATTTMALGSTPQVPHVSATPPAQQSQHYQHQRQRPTLSSTAQQPLQQQLFSAQGAVSPSAPLGRSTRKSGSFLTRRSASSDMVNGLDDSADSVLCGSLNTSGCGGNTTNNNNSSNTQPTTLLEAGSGSTPRRLSGHVPAPVTAATHRYVMDSVTSDSGVLGAAEGSRRPRRYSMATNTTDDDDTTPSPTPAAAGAPPMSTLDRLRSRRDGGGNARGTNHQHTQDSAARRTTVAAAAGSEPKTAIERWRAQEEQKRREEAQQARRHRLSARQWREAFRRLEENRMKWTMRSFIGAGTSGKVYEGVLEDTAHTPVAVKVLDVGVPMPTGGLNSDGRMRGSEDANMSPQQQEALLVLLREVEMMERLHHDNIVTCLRCQVTPVHDRFMELHHQQQQQQQQRHNNNSPQQQQQQPPPMQPGNGTDDQQQQQQQQYALAGRQSAHVSPQRASVAPRIPVQVEIIMELCKRGTLASVVRRSPGGQLPVVTARRYLRDVLKGLAYLHRNNFIHRDVKGENVLISATDVAKLADFGCSRRIVMTNSHVAGEALDGTMSSLATTHATDSRYTTMAEYQWCEATGVAQTMVGTPMFMAPEIIQASGAPPPLSPRSVDSTQHDEHEDAAQKNNNHNDDGDADADDDGDEGEGYRRNRKNGSRGRGESSAAAPMGYTASADIWSFGCLILEVFGRAPWPTAGNSVYHLMKQIEQSVDDLPPGVPQDTPQELLSVLRCCFHRDPHRRSTARMLLRTPWMTCKDDELEEMPSRKRR